MALGTYPNKILSAILPDISEVTYGKTLHLLVRVSMGDD